MCAKIGLVSSRVFSSEGLSAVPTLADPIYEELNSPKFRMSFSARLRLARPYSPLIRRRIIQRNKKATFFFIYSSLFLSHVWDLASGRGPAICHAAVYLWNRYGSHFTRIVSVAVAPLSFLFSLVLLFVSFNLSHKIKTYKDDRR